MNINWWWLSPWPRRPFSHGGCSSVWPMRGLAGSWWPMRGPLHLHPLITPGLVTPEPPGRGEAQGYPAPGIVCQMKTSWNQEKNGMKMKEQWDKCSVGPLSEPLMGFNNCMISTEICIQCRIHRSSVIIMQSESSFTTQRPCLPRHN